MASETVRTFECGLRRRLGNQLGPLRRLHTDVLDFGRGIDLVIELGDRPLLGRRAVRSQHPLPRQAEALGERVAARILAGLKKTKERKRRSRQRRQQ